MGFWISFIVSIAIAVVGELIRPKQSVPNAKASAIDDFDMPTAESGRNIAIWAGKVLIKGSNCTWYGDLKVTPLTKKVKTGLFSKKKQTYAHQYRMGIQHVLGFGRDDVTLHRVLFDNAEAKHTTSAQSDGSVVWTFNDEKLFGGNESEGGISGTMRFYPGNSTQVANAYLSSKLGKPVSALRGVCYAMFEFVYLGTSKYIKPVAFEVSSYPNQLGVLAGRHVIGEDANPACFIFEILTNTVWGVGKSSAAFDLASFRAAADTLHSEGFGISIIRNTATSAEEVIADILRHVDGVIFSDPQTGLIRMRLARNDYVVADLPVYGESDFVEAPKFSRPSWEETRNTLIVSFSDRANDYQVTPATFQELANLVQREGEVASESVDYTGFTTPEAMVKAANRSLKTYSYPLAKLSGRLTRRAWRTRPGDVIVVNWPNLNIDNIVFRVVRVGYGNIKQNSISIDVVEDIFSVGTQAYSAPPTSGWVNPAQPPQPLARQAMIEAPYFLTATGDSNVIGFASPASGLDLGVDIQTGPSAGAVVSTGGSSDFSSSGLTAGSLAAWATSTTLAGISGGTDIVVAPTASEIAVGESVVWLKSATTEEWIYFTSLNLTTGAMTGLQRGLFDTVPQIHPVGTQAWFPPTGFMELTDLPIGVFPSTLYARLVPYSALGSLPESSAVVMSATANRRALRPYPPGRIRIGGVRPDLIVGSVTSPFVLTWAHRNRLAEGLTTQDAASVTVEEGVTYTIRLKNGATVLFERSGIDSSATQASIGSTFDGDLTVEILASRDGLASYQVQSYTIPHLKGATVTNVITPDEASYVLDGGAP